MSSELTILEFQGEDEGSKFVKLAAIDAVTEDSDGGAILHLRSGGRIGVPWKSGEQVVQLMKKASRQ